MINQLEIQRIVDNECSHQERVELLASIGDDASLWRRLALRLIEDKVLQRELRPAVSLESSGCRLISLELERPTASRWNGWVTALAASALFLSFGFWSGNHYSNVADSNFANDPKPTAATLTAFEDLVPTGRMTFNVSNGEDAPFEVPVYEVSQFNPSWLGRRDAEFLSEINSTLVKRGWNASLDTEIFESELPDGRRMIVPMKNVNFEPIGY